MDLDFVCLECEVVAAIPVQLTAVLYDALRSYEAQFKALCCLPAQESCTACIKKAGCPYRIIFAQQLSSDSEIVRLHQKPSLPFSLYIHGIDTGMSSCTVGMVVIGSAINHVEIFHSALMRMVESCVRTVLPPETFTLHFYSLDYRGVRQEIPLAASLPESVILLSGRHILQNSLHADHIRLSFTSPLRLVNNGSIAHSFDFAMFFRSQLRRCSSLCAYYGTEGLDLDYVYLSRAAQNIAVLEDGIHYTQPVRSSRSNKAGLTGFVECAGLVEPMYSLLLLGSYFNAGKGAAFGSGHYHVEVL